MYMGYVLMEGETAHSWFRNDRNKPVIGVRDDREGHWWAKFIKASSLDGGWYLYTLASGADTIVTPSDERRIGGPVASLQLIAVLEEGERQLRERTDRGATRERVSRTKEYLDKAQAALDAARRALEDV
jgi:hypothetical protein